MHNAPLFMGVAQKVVYTNWKGNTRERTLIPCEIFFGSTEYHPEPQWLVSCEELVGTETLPSKDYALKDMVPCHFG